MSTNILEAVNAVSSRALPETEAIGPETLCIVCKTRFLRTLTCALNQ